MITKTVPLSELTTVHLKGVVKVNYITAPEEIKEKVVLIGGGSNILIKNAKSLHKLYYNFNYIRQKNGMLIVGAATPLKHLISYLISNGLSCLEFLAGVPATVGGAVFMNAGAFGEEIRKYIDWISIFDPISKTYSKRNDIVFDYRESNINGIILEVALKCKKEKREKILTKVIKTVKERRGKAHLTNTFGSIFKNPKNFLPAGRLIEECGLKGTKKGNAMISKKHGNFIVSQGLVDVDDILYLIDLAKNEVLKRFSVELEEEVKIL